MIQKCNADMQRTHNKAHVVRIRPTAWGEGKDYEQFDRLKMEATTSFPVPTVVRPVGMNRYCDRLISISNNIKTRCYKSYEHDQLILY